MQDGNKSIPNKRYFSPNEVAEYFSVTPDAVRKWLRSGRLRDEMTPGGHHRIPRNSLLAFIDSHQEKQELPSRKRPFQYCWEYHAGSEGLHDGCRRCIVYRSRTGRCYELAKIRSEIGHSKIYCTKTCEECDYYEMIQGTIPRFLVVSHRPEVQERIQKDINGSDVIVQFASTPYSCSKVIDTFYPDYIVVDCACDAVCCQELIRDISMDSRIPLSRIILAGNPDQYPEECDRMVFAFVESSFTLDDLLDLVGGDNVRMKHA